MTVAAGRAYPAGTITHVFGSFATSTQSVWEVTMQSLSCFSCRLAPASTFTAWSYRAAKASARSTSLTSPSRTIHHRRPNRRRPSFDSYTPSVTS